MTTRRKVGWVSAALAVLLGSMLLSPGPGGAALRTAFPAFFQAGSTAIGRLLTRISQRLQRAFLFVTLWPIAVFGVALLPLPNHWAGKSVVVTTTATVFALLIYISRQNALFKAAILTAIAESAAGVTGQFKDQTHRVNAELEKVYTKFRTAAGLLLVWGIYLAVVPVGNDRWLAGILMMVIAAGILLVGQFQAISKILGICVITATLILFLGGRHTVSTAVKTTMDRADAHFGDPPAYHKDRVCNEALSGTLGGTEEFTIELTEGCFGKMILIPEGDWESQTVTSNPGDWLVFWFDGANEPEKVRWYGSSHLDYPNRPHRFRLQGKAGLKLRFFLKSLLGKPDGIGKPSGETSTSDTYNPRHCDANEQLDENGTTVNYDFSRVKEITMIEISLEGDCFSGAVKIPKEGDPWKGFTVEKNSNDADDWAAIEC